MRIKSNARQWLRQSAWTPPSTSPWYGREKVFWGWFLIVGDTVVLILRPGKQTADKDIRGMRRRGGCHCCTACGERRRLGSLGPPRADSYVASRDHLYADMRALHHHLLVDITQSSVLYSDGRLSPGGGARRAGADMVPRGFLGRETERSPSIIIRLT